jgi:hypothetical protein
MEDEVEQEQEQERLESNAAASTSGDAHMLSDAEAGLRRLDTLIDKWMVGTPVALSVTLP